MNIQIQLKEMIHDRAFWSAWVVIGLCIIASFVISIVYIRPSDLQIPVRYSSFGITHFYREKWFYDIVFPVFTVIVAIFHTLISAKLLQIKGREFALSFLWIATVVLSVSAIFTLALFRVASLS